MKIKKYKNIIRILIFLIIGFLLGFFTKATLFKDSTVENNNASTIDISYTSKIKESKPDNEALKNLVDEYEQLNTRLDEIESEKKDIEAEILLLKNKINNSTDFKFEDELYPESENTDLEQ